MPYFQLIPNWQAFMPDWQSAWDINLVCQRWFNAACTNIATQVESIIFSLWESVEHTYGIMLFTGGYIFILFWSYAYVIEMTGDMHA